MGTTEDVLRTRWADLPPWFKALVVLGIVAFLGGISVDRVVQQRKADDFIAGFHGECVAMEAGPREDRDAWCSCLLDAIRERHGTGRMLARQSAFLAPPRVVDSAAELGCPVADR